jgi:hypothetical protein
MTHTRNTSIGASAQFWRQNCRVRGQEFVYQCSHVLKESLGGRIFRSQNDGGVAEREGTGAGAGFYFSVGVQMAVCCRASIQFAFHFLIATLMQEQTRPD